MVDPAALREALEYWDDPLDRLSLEPAERLIFAAAREFLRLIETAETVWWCEEHNEHAATKGAGNQWCWRANFTATINPCRMVSAVLTRREPAETPETEVEKNQIGMW